MSLSRSTRATLLAAMLLTACDDARIGGDSGDTDGETTRATYTREMIFVADDATAAALLDFSAVDVGRAVRRRATGWAEAGSGWTPLYDLNWQGIPVRQSWRLVPQGPMRLRVGLNGEVEAVLVREGNEDLAALEHGDFVAAWAPHPAAQIVLREASLGLGAEPIAGWLVDARFGVTEAAEAQEEQLAPNETLDEAGEAVASAAEMPQDDSVQESTATDSIVPEPLAPSDPAPATMHVRSVRAVLVGEDGETLVIGQTTTGLSGWLYTPDSERLLPIVTLTAADGERESWSIEAGGSETISGTLTVMDEDPMPVAPRIVRGVVNVGDDQLEMHGVLRPAAP